MQDFVISTNGTLLRYNGSEANVVIPKGVRKIGACAFEGCVNLQSITIPDSVKKIGRDAFPSHTLEQFDIVGESKWGIMKIEGLLTFPHFENATLPKKFKKTMRDLGYDLGRLEAFTFTDSRVKCKLILSSTEKSVYKINKQMRRSQESLNKLTH